MSHPNAAIDNLEDDTVYAKAMFEAQKKGPKFCEALRVQRNDQRDARIAAWKASQTAPITESFTNDSNVNHD